VTQLKAHPPAPVSGPAWSDESAFRALIRTYGLIERVMHPYFARFGISGAQWGVLRTLHRAAAKGNHALRMSELSERLIIRPASVTGVIDRLVRDGLVRRESLESDLRVKQIQLTSRGRELVEKILVGHEAQIASLLAGLNAGEQTEFQRLLVRLGQHLETLADHQPEGND
jgi:DNA-binding MarR family transcriptional regulator